MLNKKTFIEIKKWHVKHIVNAPLKQIIKI